MNMPEVQQMSTVQESIADSPTVPTMYPSPPFVSEDRIHNRSSSAPGERMQRAGAHLRKPSESKLRSAWTSRHAEEHPQAAKGLGLTLPPGSLAPRQPRRHGPGRPKPNLRINVDHEDRPPPPPPKSPRHSRDPSTSSIQSGVSSMHGESPKSDTVVTPGSISRAALLDTKDEPLPTPALPQHARQASLVSNSGPVRVREVAIPKDKARKMEGPSLQPPDPSADRIVSTKVKAPNIDKPMPSLPTPSKRFSAHLREVQEAERSIIKTKEDTAPPKDAPSSAPTDAIPPSKPSSDPPDRKSNDLDIHLFPQPLKVPTKPPARDRRSPTPDQGVRPQSPANSLQTASTSAKGLPVLPTEGPPHSRSGTPDSAAALSKQSEPKSLQSNPLQTLQDLNRQSEALHVRYASLRADRVKISTAITASLKDEKPGSDYAHNLLDKHLALNAINSSMDICFAKLKSLDCRKEEAMTAFLNQAKMKNAVEESRMSGSTKSLAPPISIHSGRSTPEITPELIPTSKFSSTPLPTPEPDQDKSDVTKRETSPQKDAPAPEPEKRVTIIRTGSTKSAATSNSSEHPPVSPISSMYATKRIRIKGAKAAKILGLVAQSATGKENGNKGITLPDESPTIPTTSKKPIGVEVEIQRKTAQEKKTSASETAQEKKTSTSETVPSTPPSATVPQMPKRKAPPPPRHDTKDSVGSSVASSQTESSPEEPEVKTPKTVGSADVPFGLKTAKKGMLQTIQVFVDDDIFDYYKEAT